MKESTKTFIKAAGSLFGAIGGSCASAFIVGAIAATSPVVGVPLIIGKTVTNFVIAEICSERVYDSATKLIDTIEETKEVVDEIKTKMEETEFEEVISEEA